MKAEPADGDEHGDPGPLPIKLIQGMNPHVFVSRTHINMLMDTGKLGEITRTHGGHRRIARAAVLEYKAESKGRRADGMKAMVEATDRLGLYDAEAAELRAAMKGKRA